MRSLLALICLLGVSAPLAAAPRQAGPSAPQPGAEASGPLCSLWLEEKCKLPDDRLEAPPAVSLGLPSPSVAPCPDTSTLAGSLCELRQLARLPYGLDISGPLAPAVGVLVKTLVPRASEWDTMRAWPVAPTVSYRHRRVRMGLTVGI